MSSSLLGSNFSIVSFSVDVTVPMERCMMGGLWQAKSVADPLFAKGVVLLGGEQPVALVSVGWCEIRNEAFDRWRDVIADAAGTTRESVLVSTVDQHDAPVADLGAQAILKERGLKGSICDLAFHEAAVQRVGRAVRAALALKEPITHIGMGRAEVSEISSNRRYLLPDGSPIFNRGSASAKNVLAREAPEGTIDPRLKTLSFWNYDRPLAALSAYTTHPMSYYRNGGSFSGFPW